ncbi:hypothetical protein M407DRAFT_232176 [Tulasnella calospora MUT 4182]|uniref:Uncharacterized protein n=1 Tax=Tulasnella calospora MUT 4182 TaxID=1051891 RepID=A0A0C3QKD1_9AGAM|nr:hypothetical protein M407DRAFT_232176 [Tulasnella calospora MUT 4182]
MGHSRSGRRFKEKVSSDGFLWSLKECCGPYEPVLDLSIGAAGSLPKAYRRAVKGSAISILTVRQATADHTVTGTGGTIIDVNRHLPQRDWINLHHLGQIDYSWIITVFLLLLPFLTVGAAILLERSLHQRSLRSEPVVIVSAPLDPRATIQCRVPPIETNDQPTFPTHGLVGSCKDIVERPVALMQPYRFIAWITLCSVEGFLSMDLCSPNSDCADGIQWTLTFHPRDRSCPTPSPTHPNARVTTNERLFNILYNGIPSYHPWAPQLAGVLRIPEDIINGSNKHVGLDATTITRTKPTPAIPAQAIPNTGLETAMVPAPFGDSTSTSGNDAVGYNKPATPVVSPKEDQPRADVVEEDGRATYVKEEDEPEAHHRRSKPHRGGRRAARMKASQALRAAAEAPEAGPSGPN